MATGRAYPRGTPVLGQPGAAPNAGCPDPLRGSWVQRPSPLCGPHPAASLPGQLPAQLCTHKTAPRWRCALDAGPSASEGDAALIADEVQGQTLQKSSRTRTPPCGCAHTPCQARTDAPIPVGSDPAEGKRGRTSTRGIVHSLRPTSSPVYGYGSRDALTGRAPTRSWRWHTTRPCRVVGDLRRSDTSRHKKDQRNRPEQANRPKQSEQPSSGR